ncbi:MAG: AAA family ATPase [Lachnospiraceae bacterium]|nr:AAA family ATPase [Lachnospiraceae bacterium]
MRIDFVELCNFRNIELQKISFENKNFIVLIGENGSGKTTILEAITKAFVPVLRAVNGEAVKRCDLTNGDIRCGAAASTVTVGISLEDDKYVWTNKRRLSPQMTLDEMTVWKTPISNDLKRLKSKYIECVEKRRLPLVLYYGTDRIIRDVPQRGHIKNFEVTDALRNCFDNVNYFRDFYDWFKTEEDIELRGLRDDRNYRNPKLDCVRTALERTIKGYSNLRIELAPSRMLLTSPQGTDLQIDQLSGGYKAVLSVVADIAKRLAIANPDAENPLEEEAVILIDELDLHLHPRWQKTIVEDLKRTFPNCQFIITTHSPFIIQSLQAGELFDIGMMQYAAECGSYNGWSIDVIQEQKMGVAQKTSAFNTQLEAFSQAMDHGDFERAKMLYLDLKTMVHPESPENRILDLDMEMMTADDKT